MAIHKLTDGAATSALAGIHSGEADTIRHALLPIFEDLPHALDLSKYRARVLCGVERRRHHRGAGKRGETARRQGQRDEEQGAFPLDHRHHYQRRAADDHHVTDDDQDRDHHPRCIVIPHLFLPFMSALGGGIGRRNGATVKLGRLFATRWR